MRLEERKPKLFQDLCLGVLSRWQGVEIPNPVEGCLRNSCLLVAVMSNQSSSSSLQCCCVCYCCCVHAAVGRGAQNTRLQPLASAQCISDAVSKLAYPPGIGSSCTKDYRGGSLREAARIFESTLNKPGYRRVGIVVVVVSS